MEFFKLPLLGSLIPNGIKAGSILLVEYDPESQWLSVATTIAARCVGNGLHACPCACVRSREDLRSDLAKLGLDVIDRIDHVIEGMHADHLFQIFRRDEIFHLADTAKRIDLGDALCQCRDLGLAQRIAQGLNLAVDV